MLQPSFHENYSDILVKKQGMETFYYSKGWIDFITKFNGYTYFPIIIKNTFGEVTGFLPLCYIHSALTGSRLVALPFSDHCPLLAGEKETALRLIEQATQLAKEMRVRYLELRTGPNAQLSDRSDFVQGNLYSYWKTPLVSDPDVIWSNLGKSVRNKVKKAKQSGVEIRFAEHRDDMLEYYRLHLQTRSKKHGMPSQPKRYFYELWDTFAASGSLHVILAEYRRTVIAGSILVCSGNTARFLYGASHADSRSLSPNNLLTWETIAWCCRQGYQMLVHGRTARANTGLMEFNKHWAAVEEPLPYYYYPGKAGFAATSEDSWKYKMLTSCWRRFPLSLSGPLGGYFYRHLG
jgi:hypothetical protein